jgi:putative ABC transport system permease protein
MWVFRLIFRNVVRHKLRTMLTILGLAIAVMAFIIIRTLISSYYASADVVPPDRLITRSSVSIIFSLPKSYMQKIEQVDGVVAVGYGNWFGGLYNNDPKNFFPNYAVGPDNYLDIYSEFLLAPEEKTEYLQDKKGAVAGVRLAERFGWKIGDQIQLTGQIYPGNWDLTLRGIYHGNKAGVDENSLIFHWDYLDETMRQSIEAMSGEVGWYVVKIADPSRSAEISANIDELFKNSPAETLTETEKSFNLNFLAMMSAIITGLRIMSYLIIGIILMVLVNTMAMSARERTSEYAVLKTLGFRAFHIIGLILGESMAIAALGGALGFVLSFPTLTGLSKVMQSFFSGFVINPVTYLLAVLFVVLVGLLASLFPIYRAINKTIIDGLRNIG